MKKAIFLTTLIVLSCIVNSANAACSSTACAGKVSKLYLNNADSLYIHMDQDTQPLVNAYSPGTSGCSPVSRTASFTGYFTLNKSHKLFDEIFSVLLAAKINNEDITLRIVSGSNNCTVLYAVLQ